MEEDFREEARKTIHPPTREDSFTPSPHLLKKWKEEREAAEQEAIEESDLNPNNWNPFILDRFLEAWWSFKPGLYNEYHHEYEAKGRKMAEMLYVRRPSTHQFIFGCIATLEMDEWEPPRPKLPKEKK